MSKIPNKRVGEYLQTALKIALEHGGSYPVKQILEGVEKRLDLNEYEKAHYEKSGYIRWQSLLHFWSIGLVKAGWLRKHKGVWYITEDGEKALKLDPEEFTKVLDKKYREWVESREPLDASEEPGTEKMSPAAHYEQAQSTAREEIKTFIKNLGPYDFQDLVAALIRGMGYYTPFIASPGPDGGIDIYAYKDPVGAETPRIGIQVKHRPEQKVGRAEVAALVGDLHRDGYVGIFVSTGGFSSEAVAEIRRANTHIERIDLERFIDLWEEYYDKLTDEDKVLLPLRRIALLAPEE